MKDLRGEGRDMNKTTVIICIDGLDPEYLEACEMPNLREFAKKGFSKIGQGMMPAVTNVNNVSLLTGSYPQVHGVCSNYWLGGGKGEGICVESAEYILAETIFQRAQRRGKTSILVTSKDKLHIFGRWRHHHRFIRLAPRVGGVGLR